jgi:hypothetical protein
MSDDQFHQIVSVLVHFGKLHSPGEVNRIFKTLGAKLHYDVYGFDRLKRDLFGNQKVMLIQPYFVIKMRLMLRIHLIPLSFSFL